MALTTQNLMIPFSTGVDQKTDPLQVSAGNLAMLSNAVYTKDKRLTKRNGFPNLTILPEDSHPLSLTTFKDNLTVVGERILAYNPILTTWVDRGRYQGVDLSTTALANNSYGKSRVNVLKSQQGYAVAVYLDSDGEWRYQVSDSATSQLLVEPTVIADCASAKCFEVGNYLVIAYMWLNVATPTLSYIAIPAASLVPQSPVTVSAQVKDEEGGWDGTVFMDNLYLAWNGSDVGDAVRFIRISSTLSFYPVQIISTGTYADLVTTCSNASGVWVTWYQDSNEDVRAKKMNLSGVGFITAETLLDSSQPLTHITSSPVGDNLKVLCEVENTYSFSSVRTDYIHALTCTQGGVAGGPTVVIRSLGLGSDSFIYNDVIYFLGSYDSGLQPSYFLCDESGNVIAKLAYTNGGGYVAGAVLPSVTVEGSVASMGYMLKDLLVSVNPPEGTDTNIYSQTGLSLAQFDLNPANVSTVEMAENLHISGGYVWAYDGTSLVEHNYHVFPEDLEATASNGAGTLSAQEYQYQAVYEWTDAQGNIHRSAPSLPLSITLVGPNDTITLDIPTLRLTYKENVRIVIYRWSVAQQSFYQITSVQSPLLNNPAVDSVQFVDLQPDAAILGNALIYTTGGVVENIAYPAASSLAAFKNRLMVLSSENRDLIFYSKQVFQSTPVEPSDLFSIFVSPTTGSQGSTGVCTVLTAMDDKFIIFKDDAVFYLVGDGPNDLGADNTFSEPTFISSTVGCDNQRSLALIPQGLMFQSDKGIWLLGRGLDTVYIGAPVEDSGLLNNVTSAQVIPNTNEVRFTLANTQALMYDYYFDRWGYFKNINAISSTIYEQAHTILTAQGIVRQETPGQYLDGSLPVLMDFETAWISAAGFQALERVVELFIIGQYKTPHKLDVQVSFDFEDSPTQQDTIMPVNYAGDWGVVPNFWGQGQPWGGVGSIEQFRIFFERQKVQSIKIKVQELFDPTLGAPAGEGLTISGLNFTIGVKKTRPTLPARDAST